jgi:hypothetical protein
MAGLYDKIKRLCDIKHEVPTLCVLEPILLKQGFVHFPVSMGQGVSHTQNAIFY